MLHVQGAQTLGISSFLRVTLLKSVFMGELQRCLACQCIEVNMVVATQISAASTDQILLGFPSTSVLNAVGFGFSPELCACTAVQSNIAGFGLGMC